MVRVPPLSMDDSAPPTNGSHGLLFRPSGKTENFSLNPYSIIDESENFTQMLRGDKNNPPLPLHRPPLPALAELWPVLCPIAVECSCLVYLTGLKVYFERVAGGGTAGAPRPPLLKEADGTPGKSTSVNRLLESAVGVARSPKINPKMRSSVSEYGAVTSGHKTIQEA